MPNRHRDILLALCHRVILPSGEHFVAWQNGTATLCQSIWHHDNLPRSKHFVSCQTGTQTICRQVGVADNLPHCDISPSRYDKSLANCHRDFLPHYDKVARCQTGTQTFCRRIVATTPWLGSGILAHARLAPCHFAGRLSLRRFARPPRHFAESPRRIAIAWWQPVGPAPWLGPTKPRGSSEPWLSG